jgi:hypothetical protein
MSVWQVLQLLDHVAEAQVGHLHLGGHEGAQSPNLAFRSQKCESRGLQVVRSEGLSEPDKLFRTGGFIFQLVACRGQVKQSQDLLLLLITEADQVVRVQDAELRVCHFDWLEIVDPMQLQLAVSVGMESFCGWKILNVNSRATVEQESGLQVVQSERSGLEVKQLVFPERPLIVAQLVVTFIS